MPPLRDAPEPNPRPPASVRNELDAPVHVTRAEIVPVPTPESIRRPVGDANARLPFWKRIALRRSAPSASPNPTPSLEPILERLGQLEKRLAEAQHANEQRLDRFEENITRLWELEEQIGLSEVSERLALLEATQVELADAIHSVSRNLSILAFVLAAGIAGAALAVGLLR